MKKIYTKPEIMFESFTLSENIAGNCDRIVGSPSKDACHIISGTGGITLFDGNMSACLFTPKEFGDDEWDGFCYHNPSDTNNLFNS